MTKDELDKEGIEEPIEDLEAPAEGQGDVVGGVKTNCNKPTVGMCKASPATEQDCLGKTCVVTMVAAPQ